MYFIQYKLILTRKCINLCSYRFGSLMIIIEILFRVFRTWSVNTAAYRFVSAQLRHFASVNSCTLAVLSILEMWGHEFQIADNIRICSNHRNTLSRHRTVWLHEGSSDPNLSLSSQQSKFLHSHSNNDFKKKKNPLFLITPIVKKLHICLER